MLYSAQTAEPKSATVTIGVVAMRCIDAGIGSSSCSIVKFTKEKYMAKLAILMFVIGGLLSGCVAYDDSYRRDRAHQEYERGRDGDRDRDGVPNRQDRRPDDARRY